MLKDFDHDLSKYEIIDKIGEGQFGKVYKIKNNNDSKLYAAKEIIDPSDHKRLLNEIKITAQIIHPLIVKFIGFNESNFQNAPNPVLITEYIPNKSLEHYIDLSIRGLATQEFETQKIIIIYGIAFAMKFLHSHDILHRDLKPANILLDNSFNPIICDFGLSKKDDKNDTLESYDPRHYFFRNRITVIFTCNNKQWN